MAAPPGRCMFRRVAGALAALLFLLLAGSASAVLVERMDVTASPSAKAPPLTLGAGASGTTTLGASLASASTSRTGLPVVAAEVLQVKKGAASWDVRISLDSATGFGSLDSATVSIVLGATTQNQAVVTLGSVTQSTGVAISLPTSGSDLSVKVLGTKTSAGPLVLAMKVVLVPTGGTGPTVSYPYTLTIN